MKKMFLAVTAAAAIAAMTATGVMAEEIENIEAGGLAFEIPGEYKDLLTVETEGLEDDELICVSETASIDAAKALGEDRDGAGWLFSISRVSEDELKQLRCGDMSGMEVFAKEDDTYYLFNHPTDVRMFRETNEEMAADMDHWGMLNSWASEDVRKAVLADNPQLEMKSYSNTTLDTYLARAAFEDGIKYEVRSLEFEGKEPAAVDGDDYLKDLTEGVCYEVVTDLPDEEAPDGEYIVLAFDEENVQFDFFLGEGMENYIRQVTYLDDDETIETLYKANFEDAEKTSTGIMKEWVASMLEADN